MSLFSWMCRKATCLLPYTSRKQVLKSKYLLVYGVILTMCIVLYQWPQPSVVTKTTTGQRLDSHPAGLCLDKQVGEGCVQRVKERDVAGFGGVRLTEVPRGVNTTVKTAPPLPDESLEPKNWNGGGYQPLPSSKGPIRQCKQCALVTSSGHLSGKGAGRQIDQSECVIRMNAAPTLKYEKDVGSRTTFRVVGHRNFPRMFDTEEERRLYFVNATTKSEAIVVLWLYSVNVNRNLELILARKFAPKYKDVTFYLTKQDVMNRNVELFYQELGISKNTKRLWMSTGWVAMLFALEVCDEIDVFGMIYEDYCKEHPEDKTPYHYFDHVQQECTYYERSEKRLTSGHKFMTEKVAFARWASMYKIRFHVPSWEGHGYDPNVQKETVFQRAYMQYKERMNKEAGRAGKDAGEAQVAPVAKKSQKPKEPERTKDVKDVKSGRTRSIGGDTPAHVEKKVKVSDSNRTVVASRKEKTDVAAETKKGTDGDAAGGLRQPSGEAERTRDDNDVDGKHRELDPDLIEEHVPEAGAR